MWPFFESSGQDNSCLCYDSCGRSADTYDHVHSVPTQASITVAQSRCLDNHPILMPEPAERPLTLLYSVCSHSVEVYYAYEMK